MTSQRLLKICQTPTGQAPSLPKTAVPLALQKAFNNAHIGRVRENMMVPTTATTISQKKLPEPPPLQKEAVGEEEEQLDLNPIQVSLTTGKFAGTEAKASFTSLVEYHNRPKYTGHCTALSSGDWKSKSN